MGEIVIKSEDYSLLKDLTVKFEAQEEGFTFCFWVYLLKTCTFPAPLISQVDISGSAPFLVLNEKKILKLFPLTSLDHEALDPENSTLLTEVPHASMETEFPSEKWVHVGCKVSVDSVLLHIDGGIVAEQPLSSFFCEDSMSNSLKRITLVGSDVQGFVHHAKVLPLNFSVSEHYAKDPPLQLSIDNSSASEIEEDSDGVWSIVGGKASCRRIFSVDVQLLNAFGEPVNKELEVIASLLYADNGGPVEKTSDGEAPLLTSYDGIEYASCDRPSKMLHGFASFKLKISQLSSKCDNRLFRIRFEVPKVAGYPFLEALSHPIRCISRNRTIRTFPMVNKKTPAAIHLLDGSQSCGFDDGSAEFQHNTVREAKPSPSSKRVRLEQENISVMEQPGGECNSHPWTANKAENALAKSSNGRHENFVEADNSPSDSESTGARNSSFKSMLSSGDSVSDLTIFKYCLGNLAEKSRVLKEIVTSSSDDEVLEFAHQVSIYSGCSHHRYQIIIAKKLIEEGRNAWNSISQNNHHVHWGSAIFEIEEQFMKISCCSTRSLTQQDFDLLRRIAGCGDYMAQENFEKLWCWLYPVAFTLSQDWINTTWKSTSPKWIEGFITKEEAEYSLQGPRGLQEPGTFILRFPTSRSWPHPDAGSLIVTYVGTDYSIHHRQVSVDYIYREKDVKPLQELLLAEPELSRWGRIRRTHYT
ncbi:SH2 domain-containing protein B-like [Mangifera indica]|uniref:SH2 domain-containing protein B-like n=1 Tax=Mangifera indica TaxID=29780 RepID=UPI001CFBD423|nr:SH2 domain-containing protein B-like [Mangifera indica]